MSCGSYRWYYSLVPVYFINMLFYWITTEWIIWLNYLYVAITDEFFKNIVCYFVFVYYYFTFSPFCHLVISPDFHSCLTFIYPYLSPRYFSRFYTYLPFYPFYHPISFLGIITCLIPESVVLPSALWSDCRNVLWDKHLMYSECIWCSNPDVPMVHRWV